MAEITTTALLDARVAQEPDAGLVAIPDPLGSWVDLTATEFAGRVRALARGFVARGIRHGDVIAVLSADRLEATVIDLAAGAVGAVTVPLDPAAGRSRLLRVLHDAQPTAVIVESAADFARFDELHSELPFVETVWQLGLGDLEKLADAGRDLPVTALQARLDAVTGSTAAGLLYTVDDDGAPMRTTLTHATLAGRARQVAEALGDALGTGRSLVQILPATDPDFRLVTLVAIATGTRLAHLRDSAGLVETLHSFRPTLLVGHPSTFAFIDDAARVRAEAGGRGAAFRQAHDIAVDYADALAQGAVAMGLRTRFTLADTLVLRGLRRSVGGRVSHAVSIAASSPLPPRLKSLMRALDVRPVEAFGLSSTGGIVTIERADDPFVGTAGSVGSPLEGIEVRIGDSGTALVRGPGVTGATTAAGDSGAGDTGAGRTGAGDSVAGDPGSGAADTGDGWLDTGLAGSLVDGRLVLEHRDVDDDGSGAGPSAEPDRAGADSSADF